MIPDESTHSGRTSNRALRALSPLLLVVAVTLFPQALNVTSGSALLAYGEAKWFLKIQASGTLILVPLAYLAMFQFDLGLAGLLWAIFLDEAWRGTANVLRFRWINAEASRFSLSI